MVKMISEPLFSIVCGMLQSGACCNDFSKCTEKQKKICYQLSKRLKIEGGDDFYAPYFECSGEKYENTGKKSRALDLTQFGDNFIENCICVRCKHAYNGEMFEQPVLLCNNPLPDEPAPPFSKEFEYTSECGGFKEIQKESSTSENR